jgi:hypothetical protein
MCGIHTAARGDTILLSYIAAKQSRFTSTPESEAAAAQKKERSKTDLRQSVLRTGEKTKLGKSSAWPWELQDRGWALPLLALQG